MVILLCILIHRTGTDRDRDQHLHEYIKSIDILTDME